VRALAIAALVVLAGCRDADARRAAELAALRERAASGLTAIQRYCDARAGVLAAMERGETGHDRSIEQLLLAPEALDDACGSASHAEHVGADSVR
jgi:hypothetical protein